MFVFSYLSQLFRRRRIKAKSRRRRKRKRPKRRNRSAWRRKGKRRRRMQKEKRPRLRRKWSQRERRQVHDNDDSNLYSFSRNWWVRCCFKQCGIPYGHILESTNLYHNPRVVLQITPFFCHLEFYKLNPPMFIFKMSCASGTEQDQWPDCHGLPEATCGGW